MTSTRAKDEMAKCKSYANYCSIAGSEIDCLSFSNQVFKNLVRVFAFGELSCLDLCTLLCTRPCSDTPLNLSKWCRRHAGARWSERLDAASQKGLLCIHCPTMAACLQTTGLVRRRYSDPLRPLTTASLLFFMESLNGSDRATGVGSRTQLDRWEIPNRLGLTHDERHN